jgi:hypothetical protein
MKMEGHEGPSIESNQGWQTPLVAPAGTQQ